MKCSAKNLLIKIKNLEEANVEGKTVFLRADLDVPLSEVGSQRAEDRKIEDDTRLVAGLSTIEYLLKHNVKVIVGGHLGRPKGVDQNLSLESIANWFDLRFKIKDLRFTKLGEFAGWEIGSNIFLLENLRFYKGEVENDPGFSKKLASLAEVYVNDAFAMCHRNHASVVGITKFLPHFVGFHLQKEIAELTRVLEKPKRPLVVIVGGKKIETKLPLVIKMSGKADYILVGGKIAEESKEFIKIEQQESGSRAVLLVADLNPDRTGILENSILNFVEIISLAKTVVWNGTMGKIENEDDFNHASRRIAEAILKSKAYSVVGGGDTTEFLRKIGLIDKFSFSSTGGGAMLAFLSGSKLPGLEALLR